MLLRVNHYYFRSENRCDFHAFQNSTENGRITFFISHRRGEGSVRLITHNSDAVRIGAQIFSYGNVAFVEFCRSVTKKLEKGDVISVKSRILYSFYSFFFVSAFSLTILV